MTDCSPNVSTIAPYTVEVLIRRQHCTVERLIILRAPRNVNNDTLTVLVVYFSIWHQFLHMNLSGSRRGIEFVNATIADSITSREMIMFKLYFSVQAFPSCC